MKTLNIKVHEVAIDGLPDMDALIGRVAFIFDGCIVSGWPLADHPPHNGLPVWEANSDVGRREFFANVTHWVEFPLPLYEVVPPCQNSRQSN